MHACMHVFFVRGSRSLSLLGWRWVVRLLGLAVVMGSGQKSTVLASSIYRYPNGESRSPLLLMLSWGG